MMDDTFDLLPDDFPAAWAREWGEDDAGLWMTMAYKGVPYTFRWMTPGRFLMGSPESEPDRDSDETQHEVILTRGFWLGETPVTQALWQAAMGGIPSRFKGPDRPVEEVSWEDAQGFIARLNGERDDLFLRLPSEAEWEYACRAGTTTPFWFGEQITTEQANYNGNNPYAGGPKGEYREATVEVRALPANAWDLYQMHGNVYEWCQDWYGDYPPGLVTEPKGPETGPRRVLRGGSWFINAWRLRSAFRFHWEPGIRSDFTGFRLARGRTVPGGESE